MANNVFKDNVKYSFALSDSERDGLLSDLLAIGANPYTDYQRFVGEINGLKSTSVNLETLKAAVEVFRASDDSSQPFIFGRNCPIDPTLPSLDWESPVEWKRAYKRSFVSEGLLTLMAGLLDCPIVAHRSVNDGDFFHDIAPKKSMVDSQSQKTLGTLRFHRDFTNHYACPDYVLQIVLRNDPVNEVYSTYVSNREVIEALPQEVVDVLRRPDFYTPFDDISLRSSRSVKGDTENHMVLEGPDRLKVFEGRTKGLNSEAAYALTLLLQKMHACKIRNVPRPGDFVLIRNYYSLHGKEVEAINDPSALQQRWIMKTHNVRNIKQFESFFEAEAYGVIDG